MEILENIYELAAENLTSQPIKWDSFAHAAKKVLACDLALYRAYGNPETGEIEKISIICTSRTATMKEYIDGGYYKLHPITETELPPFQPNRRSDHITNKELENLGVLSDFLLPNGFYYQMLAPAVLSDGGFVGLYLWRPEDEPDFSDLEMQRAALIIRHLLAILRDDGLEPTEPNDATYAFGRKWDLTEAETDILSEMLQGQSLRAIGAASGRTYGTVRWHIRNILEKCQVNSQKDLMREFYQLIQR